MNKLYIYFLIAFLSITTSVNAAVYPQNVPIKTPKSTLTGRSTLTIATGAVTVTKSYHDIDTQGAAASDDLDTINGGVDGQELIIGPLHTDRTVVVTEAGNIYCGGSSISLDSTKKGLFLVYHSTLGKWRVSGGSAASAGNVATDTIWAAAGDLVQGTGDDTAAVLTKGAEGTFLQAGAASNAYSAYKLPATVPTVGKVLISDGTDLIGSTALGSAAYTDSTSYQAADAEVAAIAGLPSLMPQSFSLPERRQRLC